MIIVILIVFGLLALSDFPPLIKNKRWYEVTALSCLYVLTITLASLITYDVTLPSPIKGIEKFIVEVLHLGYPKL